MSFYPSPGTPPFMPTEPVHTGGTDLPPRQRGLAGFLDRVFNPTNALGQFGQALVAAGGNPGNAMAYMMQQNNARNQPSRFDEWRQQYDYEGEHPHASTAQPHYWESNDGSLHAIGADGQPTEVYHDPTPKMNFIPDGQGGGQWVAVPISAPGSLAPPRTPAGTLGADLPPGWKIDGGAGGNASGNFRVR